MNRPTRPEAGEAAQSPPDYASAGQPLAFLYRDDAGQLKIAQTVPAPANAFPVYTFPPSHPMGSDEAPALPGFVRSRVERAIDSAVNPKGMSVNDGMARIHSSDLAYMLKLIDALRQQPAQPAASVMGEVRMLLSDEDREILLAVHRELDRDGGDGNAPGHGHEVPGIWDSDNGAKAGKPCAWCLTWRKFTTLIAESKPGTLRLSGEKGGE